MMNEELYINMLRENHKKMLLTKRDAAKELSMSEATLDRLRKAGEITAKQVMGKIFFPIDEVARFLAEA